MSSVRRREKTEHHDGQRSKAGGELDPWSLVPFEPLIPFRDFRQEALPAWSTRHGCSYFSEVVPREAPSSSGRQGSRRFSSPVSSREGRRIVGQGRSFISCMNTALTGVPSEKSDRRLLRPRGERPYRRRAAEKRYDIAALHLGGNAMPWWVSESGVGGTSSTLAAIATRRRFPASPTHPAVSVVGRNGLGLGRGLDI